MPGPISGSPSSLALITTRNYSDLQNTPPDFGTGGTAVRTYTAKDDFNDVDADIALAGTVTSQLTGTLTTYSDSLLSTFHRRNHEFHIRNGVTRAGLNTGTSFSHTAGKTFIAYFKIPDVTSADCRIGFRTSAIGSGAYVSNGLTIGNTGVGHTAGIYAIVAGTAIPLFTEVCKPDETYGVAVRLTAGGWEGWVQGGYFERYGCKLNSSEWVRVFTASSTISGTLTGAFEDTLPIASTIIVKEAILTSDFNPTSVQVNMIEADATLYDTHEAATVYDATGNLWVSWFKGTTDSGSDGKVLLACRLAQGVWSATTTIATNGASVREDNGNLSVVNGSVWLTTNTTTDGFTTSTAKHRTLSIDSSATITVGAATSFGLASGLALNYTKIAILSNGHLVLPVHSATQWWSAVSTDTGSTWTEGAKTSGVEPAITIEGDGTLAAYIRVGAASSTNVPRYTSTNEGSTWSIGGTLTGILSNASRFWVTTLPSGNPILVGNDSGSDAVRINATAWEIGAGGAVLSKISLTQNPNGNQNYPAIATFADKMTLVCPFRSNGSSVPGYVLVSEQPFSKWGVKTSQVGNGYAKAGANNDIVSLVSPVIATPVIGQINGAIGASTLILNATQANTPGLILSNLGSPVGQVFSSSTGVMDCYVGSGAGTHAYNISAAGKFAVSSGKFNITGIPTSSSGLSSGDVYSNAGILTIVP